MRSLVTGGLGFVGSNLVDILINSGDEVFILDDLSSESSFIENQNEKINFHITLYFDSKRSLFSRNLFFDGKKLYQLPIAIQWIRNGK